MSTSRPPAQGQTPLNASVKSDTSARSIAVGTPPSASPASKTLDTFWTVLTIVGSLTAGSSLGSTIVSFSNYRVYVSQYRDHPRLTTFFLTMGILHIVASGVDLFGVYCMIWRRLALIRLCALLSGLSVLLVTAAGILRIVAQFSWKTEILTSCVTTLGRENGRSLTEATDWCHSHSDLWFVIMEIFCTLFFSIMFLLVAFKYSPQVSNSTRHAIEMPSLTSQPQANNYYTAVPSSNDSDFTSSVNKLQYQSYAASLSEGATSFTLVDEADGRPPEYTSGPGCGMAGDHKGEDESMNLSMDSDKSDEINVMGVRGPRRRGTFH